MKKSVKFYVYRYLDKCDSPCIISGLHLQKTINSITNKETYASTILDYVRDYADITGSEFKCIHNQKSMYNFVREHTLENAFCDK
jgi:hypothetical protein